MVRIRLKTSKTPFPALSEIDIQNLSLISFEKLNSKRSSVSANWSDKTMRLLQLSTRNVYMTGGRGKRFAFLSWSNTLFKFSDYSDVEHFIFPSNLLTTNCFSEVSNIQILSSVLSVLGFQIRTLALTASDIFY